MSEAMILEALANGAGKLVARTEPSAETKWLGWDVLLYEGTFYACVMDKGEIAMVTPISAREVEDYGALIP